MALALWGVPPPQGRASEIAGRACPGVGEDKAPGYSAARRCGLLT